MTSKETGTTAVRAVAALSRPGGALDLGHDNARIAIRIIRLLASDGQPVARDRALGKVAELGIDRATADALLDAWTERPDNKDGDNNDGDNKDGDNKDGDNNDGDNADIVGLGVTYNPTAHEMTVDGVRMWAWCGMDTLIFSHILDRPVTIASKAPGTGDLVRLQASPSGITDLDPADAVATQRVPDRDQVDLTTKTGIWGTFCHHNFFFPNRTQAERWAAGRDDIAILTMSDAFTVARDMAGALLRYEPKAPTDE